MRHSEWLHIPAKFRMVIPPGKKTTFLSLPPINSKFFQIKGMFFCHIQQEILCENQLVT